MSGKVLMTRSKNLKKLKMYLQPGRIYNSRGNFLLRQILLQFSILMSMLLKRGSLPQKQLKILAKLRDKMPTWKPPWILSRQNLRSKSVISKMLVRLKFWLLNHTNSMSLPQSKSNSLKKCYKPHIVLFHKHKSKSPLKIKRNSIKISWMRI